MGFKVGDKVKFNIDNHQIADEFGFDHKKTYEVHNVFHPQQTVQLENDEGIYHAFFCERLELVEPKKTKNQRITELEETVKHFRNELDRAFEVEQGLIKRIESLEFVLAEKSKFSRTATLEGAEINIKPFLTPNQQRAEIIEKAKKFVEVKSEYLQDSVLVAGGFSRKEKENPKYAHLKTKVEFVVNAEKLTVVAILKTYSGEILEKAIAKCHPQEVFNEHIGKAIALGRALNLDVSEFEQAVQPTEFVVGQKVFYKSEHGESFSGVRTVSGFNTGRQPLSKEKAGYMAEEKLTIINDTNAIYEGVK